MKTLIASIKVLIQHDGAPSCIVEIHGPSNLELRTLSATHACAASLVFLRKWIPSTYQNFYDLFRLSSQALVNSSTVSKLSYFEPIRMPWNSVVDTDMNKAMFISIQLLNLTEMLKLS